MEDQPAEKLTFKLLPAFAGYIAKNRLQEYVMVQSRLARELNIPLLKYFSHFTPEEMLARGLKSSGEFLQYLVENRAAEQLAEAISKWENNRLEFIGQDQIQLDDLLLISYLRKRAFTEMLPLYTADISLMLSLIEEVDAFFLTYDRGTSNTYVQLLRDRIKEDSYFKEKLTDTSPGFYYIYDIGNDRQVQASDKLFKFLGYDESDFAGNDTFFRSILHPDDFLSAMPYLEKVKNGPEGEVHFFEYRMLTKQGEYKWMRNYESIYRRDTNGEAITLLGVSFDISEERAVMDKLLDRETELLEAQELANMGSYSWSLNDGKTYKTKQTDLILGLKEGEKLEEFIHKIHPADRAMVLREIERSLSGDGNFEAEYRYITDGKEKVIWGKGRVEFENGIPVFMKGTVMDVTDKHHMVQKLKRSESLYKQAETLNNLGNWTWEIKTDKLEWSDELYRIYGLEPQSETVNFERFVSFIHPADREERLRMLEQQMKDHLLHEYHFRIITPGGTEKILYGQSRVLTDEEGVPFKFLGTCQDVTRQKVLENTLRQKTTELERSNASLQDFAYISSHDLKEPLRKIAVFGDKLRILEGDGLKPESRKAINKMTDAARRLQQMVDELLALSQITSEEQFDRHCLGDILKETLQLLEDKISEAGAVITHDDLPCARVNEVQIRQLFENLLSNALKFRKDGVPPVISITHSYLTKPETEKLQLDPSVKYLRLEFKDNGIGFSKDLSERIFTIFQRLHRNEFEGTGIGLALCKKIAEHHRGLIYADSEEGAGAVFTLVLPEE